MLGSIIHNANVVAELEALGMRKAESWQEVLPGETVVIRSHGEKKEVFEKLEELGARCVNATCPNVLRIQQLVAQAQEEGRTPLIIGGSPSPGGHGCGQLVGSVGNPAGTGRAGKMAGGGRKPPGFTPNGGGTNYLCTNNLGKF